MVFAGKSALGDVRQHLSEHTAHRVSGQNVVADMVGHLGFP
jgi:hypothetical protein